MHIKEAMKVQSYFNVLSKVDPISPYYISIFAYISITKGDREKLLQQNIHEI